MQDLTLSSPCLRVLHEVVSPKTIQDHSRRGCPQRLLRQLVVHRAGINAMYSTHRASLILTRLICVAFALFFLWDTIGHFQRGSFLHALAGSVLVCFFLLILFF